VRPGGPTEDDVPQQEVGSEQDLTVGQTSPVGQPQAGAAGEQSEAADDGSNDKDEANPLVGVVALVAPLLTTIGLLTATGTVGRVMRNEPVLFSASLAAVVVGSGMWIWAKQLDPEEQKKWRRTAITLAVFFAMAGFAGALVATVQTADDESRPQIAAKVGPKGTKLKATVKAFGMEKGDRLAIEVDALKRRRAKADPKAAGDPFRPNPRRVYRAYMGPDEDGKVTYTFRTPIPRRGYSDISIKAFSGDDPSSCESESGGEPKGAAKGSGAGADPKGAYAGEEVIEDSPGASCVTMPIAKPRAKRKQRRRSR
jgi:hypothetical protein